MAKKTKKQQTTRDTSFNYNSRINVAENTIESLVSYNTTTKGPQNVKLLDLEDGIKVYGKNIIDHADNNRTLSDLGYTDAKIITGLIPDEKFVIYGAPFQVVLNNRQHFNNCGVESTLNNLAMAGIVKMKSNLKDQKSIEKKFLKTMLTLGLVDDEGVIGKMDEPDGGTLPDDYRDMLRNFGIDSKAYFISNKCDGYQYKDIGELAYKISQGHGAVLGVCADLLWQETDSTDISINHAVSITGVVYAEGVNPANYDEYGNITSYNAPVGFYIHDTGAWMTRFISYEEFKKVTLYDYHGMLAADADKYINYEIGCSEDKYSKDLRMYDTKLGKYIGKEPEGIFVTVTEAPIKSDMFNLNATGDKRDNMLIGNNYDNVLKGMSGNDTLYGNSGDDEIRGGKGNDIIIGNNLSSEDKEFLVECGFNLSDIDATDVYKYGRNALYGDSGNDIIIGGCDVDLIYGGSGNDYIWSGDGRNAVYAGKGNDVILGGNDNDRLFGDAGNDTIYGFDDDDTIHAGSGNDTIYGGKGNDKIETGKGTDTVYFEGFEHGVDTITSQGGKTVFKFIGDTVTSPGAKVNDLFFALGRDEDNKKSFNLGIAYTSDEKDITDGVKFNAFFSAKSGKNKSLDIVESDGDTETTYKVTASKSKTIKATKGNNVLFSTREKGATVTTGNRNDYITFVETEDIYNTYYESSSVYDKITYTGGKDKYVSEERNTYYYVKDFGESTNLTISDNVEGLEKYKGIDPSTLTPILDKNVVSTDDRLYFDCAKESIKFFFDVGLDNNNYAVTTCQDRLYMLNSFNQDYAEDIITGDVDVSGFVCMNSFFGHDVNVDTAEITYRKFADNNFYGNGQIEHLYCAQNEYENFGSDLSSIASQVATWLSSGANTTGQKTAFGAFAAATETTDLSGLIAAYTPNQDVIGG